MSTVMLLLLVAFLVVIGVVILLAFQLMSLSDLESNFINVFDLASQVNRLIFPEYALQAVLSLLYLFSGQWLMFIICAPSLCYNLKLYSQHQHLIDVTEIFNLLNKEKSRRLYKLVYLVIMLSLTLLGMIMHSATETQIADLEVQ